MTSKSEIDEGFIDSSPLTDSVEALPAAREEGLESSALIEHPERAGGGLRQLIWLIPIVALIAGCYSPAVINAFVGDDFLHVDWLIRAEHDAGLIWANFCGPWMGDKTVKFYRPLVSITMWSDYRLWGFNAAGFHLTNILFHTVSAACLFFIGKKLALLAGGGRAKALTVGLFAAALWAVFPLGPESVAWITGRVDATVTTFSLLSFWTYLIWRERSQPRFFLCSVAFFVLALLCKEMAVILPPLFLTADVLFFGGPRKLIRGSVPFWLILVGYFVLRQVAMGTVIGAYDDQVSTNLSQLWKRYKTGMPYFVLPFNQHIFQRSDFVVQAWSALLATIVGTGIAGLAFQKFRSCKFQLFCLVWFALSLIPVYKVFNVADNLEGSRYAYLATVPLCLLIAALAAPSWRKKKVAILQCAIFVALTGLAAFALHAHNLVWQKAGNTSNSIRLQIAQLMKGAPTNSSLILIGAPDNVDGAYVMRNALPGMVKQPFFPFPVKSYLVLDRFCRILPFAILRDEWAKSNGAFIALWNDVSKKLERTKVAPSSGEELEFPLSNISVGGAVGHLHKDGLTIAAPQKFAILDLKNIDAVCSDFDFVKVSIEGESENLNMSTMVYVNDMHPNPWPTFSSTVKARAIKRVPGKYDVIFPLRQHPEWVFGGRCSELVFGIPADKFKVASITAVDASKFIPKIMLPVSGATGFVYVINQPVKIDVALGKGESAWLEISPQNGSFERLYSESPENASSLTKYPEGRAVVIDRASLKSGTYQARIWTHANGGSPQKLSSDHFSLIVP